MVHETALVVAVPDTDGVQQFMLQHLAAACHLPVLVEQLDASPRDPVFTVGLHCGLRNREVVRVRVPDSDAGDRILVAAFEPYPRQPTDTAFGFPHQPAIQVAQRGRVQLDDTRVPSNRLRDGRQEHLPHAYQRRVYGWRGEHPT